jgi:hypothetical protein
LFAGGCSGGIGRVACGGSLSNSVTITPGNVGGQNVLILSSINLGNGATVTLGDGGNANTSWVIEDEGDLKTSHSSIIAQNGNVKSVLVEVNGQEHTTGGLNQESILDCYYIVPTGTAQNSPGLIDGELIAGGSQITFVSGESVVSGGSLVTVPEPMYEPFSALLVTFVLGRVLFQRRSYKK